MWAKIKQFAFKKQIMGGWKLREWSINLRNKFFAMDAALLEKLEHLPPSQQQVLLDFAEYLLRK